MATQPSEESPLLGQSEGGKHHDGDAKPRFPLPFAARVTIGVASLGLMFSVEIADSLLGVARTQVAESIVCRKRFPDVALGSSDPRCKDDKVQSELSMLQATEFSCALLPGLLTAVPWGVVADRRGRIFVLRLTMLGLVLYEGVNTIICIYRLVAQGTSAPFF